jgi:DNA-binding LacI/PurR family transcriptional regulator
VERRQTVARRHIPCVAKTLVLAYGFTHELIADLVQAELATVVQDTATIGEQTIEVELVMITDAGRRGLDDLTARRP